MSSRGCVELVFKIDPKLIIGSALFLASALLICRYLVSPLGQPSPLFPLNKVVGCWRGSIAAPHCAKDELISIGLRLTSCTCWSVIAILFGENQEKSPPHPSFYERPPRDRRISMDPAFVTPGATSEGVSPSLKHLRTPYFHHLILPSGD